MNITVKQINFASSSGENTVCGWIYTPANPPRGAVQLVHGMAEHMGRYHELMRFLAQNGYAACGIDQLGHGRTAGEIQGYFAEQDGWKCLVEDQYRFFKVVQSELSGCATAMLGHSMGSFVARRFTARYPHTIAALALSGTGRSGLKVDAAIQLADRSCRRNGVKYPDVLLDRLAFGSYNERCKPAQSKFDWLTRDREVVQQYEADAQCGFLFSASAFRDLFALIRRANDKKCYHGLEVSLPILLFSGDMDPVGEYGKGVRTVYEKYSEAGMTNMQMRLYPGGRHEMLNETNREQVWEDLLRWLDSCFPAI